MISSIFLARVFGVYILLADISFLIMRKNLLPRFIERFINSLSLRYTAALFIMLLGLVIVFGHNVWQGWPLIITIMGYIILMKGLVLFWLPAREATRFIRRVAFGRCKFVFTAGILVSILLGLYLVLQGFYLI